MFKFLIGHLTVSTSSSVEIIFQLLLDFLGKILNTQIVFPFNSRNPLGECDSAITISVSIIEQLSPVLLHHLGKLWHDLGGWSVVETQSWGQTEDGGKEGKFHFSFLIICTFKSPAYKVNVGGVFGQILNSDNFDQKLL